MKAIFSILILMLVATANAQIINVCDTLKLKGIFTTPVHCPECAAIDIEFKNLPYTEFECNAIFKMEKLEADKYRLIVKPTRPSDEIIVKTKGENFRLNIPPTFIKAENLYSITFCGAEGDKAKEDNAGKNTPTATKTNGKDITRETIAKYKPEIKVQGLPNDASGKDNNIQENIAWFIAEINYAYEHKTIPVFTYSKVDTNAIKNIKAIWLNYNRFHFEKNTYICEAQDLGIMRKYTIRDLGIHFADSSANNGRRNIAIILDNFGKITDLSISANHNEYAKLISTCSTPANRPIYNNMLNYIERFVTGINYTNTFDFEDDTKYMKRLDNVNSPTDAQHFKNIILKMKNWYADNYHIITLDEDAGLYFASVSLTNNTQKIYIGMQWSFKDKKLPFLECMLLSNNVFKFY